MEVEISRLARLAEQLRRAHRESTPLLLPNAWDPASARQVVAAGFPVVATTSGGVAASLGGEDGERTPADDMLAAVTRIAGAVECPVTADLESGYGLPPHELARRLLQTGAVGCNLEDSDHRNGGLVDAAIQAAHLRSFKEAARSLGVDLVLNARVDVFLRQLGAPSERVTLALERASLYAEAGADCVYPILASEEELGLFAARHPGPVNGLPRGGAASLERLVTMGLARISLGTGLQRLALGDLGRRLRALAQGDPSWAKEA